MLYGAVYGHSFARIASLVLWPSHNCEIIKQRKVFPTLVVREPVTLHNVRAVVRVRARMCLSSFHWQPGVDNASGLPYIATRCIRGNADQSHRFRCGFRILAERGVNCERVQFAFQGLYTVDVSSGYEFFAYFRERANSIPKSMRFSAECFRCVHMKSHPSPPAPSAPRFPHFSRET